MNDELRSALDAFYSDALSAARTRKRRRVKDGGLSSWPMVSEALAVHPSQVEEANERNKRAGVPVEYDPAGFAHVPSRGARRKLLRVEGFHDRRGGYGD